MKLDDLISKYLDGELSYSDDQKLRQMLKENPDSKADFDAAVLINATIREDASSIKTPGDLLANTEDLVLMRILAEEEKVIATREKRRIIGWLPRLSFVFAIVIFSTIYFATNYFNSFEDKINTLNFSNLQSSTSPQVNNKNTNENFIQANFSKSKTNKITKAKNSLNFAKNYSLSEPYTDKSEPFEFVNSPEIAYSVSSEFENKTKANASLPSIASNEYSKVMPDFSFTITNTSFFSLGVFRSDIPYENRLKPMINLPMLDNVNTPVVFNTLFSTSRYNNKPFNTLSQSIGYVLEDKYAIGIEFGYTSYNYNQSTNIKVPLPTGALSSKVEIGSSAEQSGEFVNLPINIEQNYKQYWISTYFDYNILDNSLINLNSRLGAGLSGNGVLAYTRLMTEFELYSGIYLKFGGELKTFEALMHNAKSKYITTGALLYGLQLKLY